MKVFISPKYPFGQTDSLYPATTPGELVTPWTCGMCTVDNCPHIGFIGMESNGIASFAIVAERPDVDEETLALMLKASPSSRHPLTGELEEYVSKYLDFVAHETIDFAGHYEIGQMVERCIGGVVGVTLTRPQR